MKSARGHCFKKLKQKKKKKRNFFEPVTARSRRSRDLGPTPTDHGVKGHTFSSL